MNSLPASLLLAALIIATHATSFIDDILGLDRPESISPVVRQQGSCSTITIPPNMCNSCNLLPYDQFGNFAIRKEIYDIDAPACRDGIREYVELNPCDGARVSQFNTFDNPDSHAALGVFMYSICETCCDCVPIGARVAEYRQRRRSRSLLAVGRGNCPAHAVYDICAVWPNIRATNRPGRRARDDWDEVCPLLKEWRDGPQSIDWMSNPDVDMDPRIRRFLRRFSRDAGCKKRHLWSECTAMEVAQGRVR